MSYLARPAYYSGLIIFLIITSPLSAENGSLAGALIESVRKDGIVTILSHDAPFQKKYELSEQRGSLTVLQTLPCRDRVGYYFRTIARFEGSVVLKTGDTVVLEDFRSRRPLSYIGERSGKSFVSYKNEIRSRVDGRQMILIPAGRFYMGNNSSDQDEYPRHIEYLDSYYIDKYEVSNADYFTFTKKANAAMPRSWGGVFPEQLKEYPVIVSYSEAVAFCRWAEKTLPTESEWEKAANGSRSMVSIRHQDGYFDILEKTEFTYGNVFDAAKSKCMEVGISTRGKDLQSRKILNPYLPVSFGGPEFSSAFGVYHMAGNAQEWTDSWYDAYPGNSIKDFRFGMKYKVIKGGAWYSSRDRIRITSREIGGTPNLDEDVIAGFRCVKPVSPDDKKN